MTLGTLLLVAAVKGSVGLSGAWVIMRAFPRMSAALRHLLWASALGALVLMPVLIRVAPALQSRFVPAIPVVTSIQTRELPSAMGSRDAAATTAAEQPPAGVAVRSTHAAPVAARLATEQSINLEHWFPIAWAVVAAALVLRMVFGRLRLAMLARNAHVVDDGDWLLLVQRLAHRLDISRPVTLLRSDRSCVPMTWGLVYPTVLLPFDADEWTDERRTIVLLHELAHISRLDAFTQSVAQIATAVFWFNPLSWLAARAMRIERELACDDCVLASGARPSDYAQDLLQIARSFSARSDLAAAALAMARRGDLEDRLMAILDPSTDRSAVSRTRLLGATVGVLAVTIPLAALSPAPVQAAELRMSARAPVADAEPITIAPKVATSRSDEVVAASPEVAASIARLLSTPFAPGPRVIPAGGVPAGHVEPRPAASTPSPLSLRRSGEPDRETLISVAQAATKLTTSYDKAELLVPIAKYYLADDELATAYVTAAASISGDYDCSRAMQALLAGSAPLSDKVIELAMNATATRMTADYEKGNVIGAALGDSRMLGPDGRRAVIAAIATIRASYDRRVAIHNFVKNRQFNEQDAIGLINATTKVTGSYDRAEALVDISTHHGLEDAGVRQAYMKAAETITAPSDYRRAIESLIKRS